MKILAITDIHSRIGYVRKLTNILDEVDVAVIAGDVTYFESTDYALEIISLISGRKITVFVPGNCDDPSLIEVKKESNAVNIHGDYYILDEVVFVGVGGSNITPFNTPIEYSEEELWKLVSNVFQKLSKEKFKGLKILVSHPPPYNTKLDKTYFGQHVGSISIRKVIELFKPNLCICGHIHEARGVDKLGETIILNRGPLMRKYYARIERKNTNIGVS